MSSTQEILIRFSFYYSLEEKGAEGAECVVVASFVWVLGKRRLCLCIFYYENFVAFILCYCAPFDFMQDQELALLKAAVFASMKEVSEICTYFSVTMMIV